MAVKRILHKSSLIKRGNWQSKEGSFSISGKIILNGNGKVLLIQKHLGQVHARYSLKENNNFLS